MKVGRQILGILLILIVMASGFASASPIFMSTEHHHCAMAEMSMHHASHAHDTEQQCQHKTQSCCLADCQCGDMGCSSVSVILPTPPVEITDVVTASIISDIRFAVPFSSISSLYRPPIFA